MIRLTEDVMGEVSRRGCPPLESYTFTLRLQMWPNFQKAMTEHVDALKKLADSAASGGAASFFSRGAAVTDDAVLGAARRYVLLFNALVALTYQEEETMIFSK
jgi:vacuolar protein sorting-associated protein 52